MVDRSTTPHCVTEITNMITIENTPCYVIDRDIARTHPACVLDGQFPEKFLFRLAKISMKNFQFFGIIIISFHNKPPSKILI